MATLTINPATADTRIIQNVPDTNADDDELDIKTLAGNLQRSLLRFDFSALPAGATITGATLKIYYFAYANDDPVGKTFDACELTQTGWIENEATWNSYKTGSAWTSAGGDFTATDKASATVPASAGWMSWNVLALIQHFQSDHSEIANLIVKDSAESSNCIAAFYSSENASANKPYLEITYTAGGSNKTILLGVNI